MAADGPLAPVAVRVVEPLEERGLMTTFVTYRILMLAPAGHPHAGLHDTRRRYSDFDLLWRTLVQRYVGMVVPPLPGKAGLLGGWGSSFATHRLRGLALFAERLARIPTLLLDSLSAAFFALPGADDWEAAVRRITAERFDRNHNPGQLRWMQLINSVSLPSDTQEVERLAVATMNELKRASEALAALEVALEKALLTASAHADAMAAVASATAEWARLEDTEVHAMNTLPSVHSPSSSATASPTQSRRASRAAAADFASAASAALGGGYLPGHHTPLAALLRHFSSFSTLESHLQSAQPAMLEQLCLEAVRFERKVLAEAIRVAGHRATIAAAYFKASDAVRMATGEPRPKDVTRLRALGEEMETLNKAFLHLELRRLAESRLQAVAEVSGHIFAVRSAHGGLLQQAAESFFTACRRQPKSPAAAHGPAAHGAATLPAHVRDSMNPPVLRTHAASILADAGSPHALLAATTPSWRPPATESSPALPVSTGNANPNPGTASPKARSKSPPGPIQADEGEGGPAVGGPAVRAARKKSARSRQRARSPSWQDYAASSAPTAEPQVLKLTAENLAAATAALPSPDTSELVSTSPVAAPPTRAPALPVEVPPEAEVSPGRNALLADIQRRRVD